MAFGRNNEIPMDVGTFLHSRLEEVWRSFELTDEDSNNSRPIRREVYIRWNAPPTDWFCLNTDGASKQAQNLAGGGGVVLDHCGIFRKAFAANLGSCTAYKAELLVAMLGLEMARDMGIQKLVLQLDNKACVQALKNPEYQGGECHYIIQQCRNLISVTNWEIVINHSYREGNKVADCLANLGVIQEERIRYFHTPPYEISKLLFEDIMGVTTPRFVI